MDEHFDWSGDCKPSIPWAKTIVYELNVKGFSQLNSRIPENIRGTYEALVHPEILRTLNHWVLPALNFSQ